MSEIRIVDHPPALRETTGDRVRRLRQARGWTQLELAAQAGVSVTVISRAENGAEMFVYSMAAVATALDTCLCYLWAGGAGCEHADEGAS